MNHEHEIPSVGVTKRKTFLVVGGIYVVLAVAAVRHAWYIEKWQHYRVITILWTVSFAITAIQWIVSWLEKPYTVDAAGQKRLDRMKVTVNIPVYNEEPEVLDRVLYALFRQSRLPNRVQVVDDGSKVDYSEVRDYWLAHSPVFVDFSWHRQANAGKKRAQARTFGGDNADVFVTLDSDTTLPRDAIAEGVKPFVDPRVNSVAGIELAWNYGNSLLTRIKGVNALIWQFTTCSAQNVAGGQVIVNRGTFALYRGSMIRETLRAYIGETFFGRPVMLGDDTMLTLFALGRGRAVQQPSAMCFAVYPENLVAHVASMDPVDAWYLTADALAIPLSASIVLELLVHSTFHMGLHRIHLSVGRDHCRLAAFSFFCYNRPIYKRDMDMDSCDPDVRCKAERSALAR